jgi:hypothetical protein
VQKAVGLVDGNLDAHARAAADDCIIHVFVVLDVADDMESVRVFEAVEQFTALAAAVAVENDRVDLSDVGIDAESQQHHLENWDD